MEPQVEQTATPETGGSSKGPIIGAIVILAVIVLGGLYFWQRDTAVDNQIESINTQSESDQISDIEADLEGTEIDDLGSELDEATL